MKKYLGLVISSAFLLAGCGSETTSSTVSSGGSSSTSTSYYTFNFVELDAVGTLPSSSSSSSCKVYDYDDPTDPSEYIIGYPSNGEDLVITVHEDDGSLVDSYSVTDWGYSNSQFRLVQSTVPDDGYISVSVNNVAGSEDHYSVITIEKSLIPTSMAINADGRYNTSCITGSNLAYTELSGYLYNYNTKYYGFNSYNQDTSDLVNYYSLGNEGDLGTDSGITFTAPTNKQIMGVRYAYDSANEVGELEAFGFFSVASFSSTDKKALTDVDISALDWNIPTDVDTLTKAEINIDYSTYGSYLWQPLSTTADDTYSYASSVGDSNYYLWLEGTESDWTFTLSAQLSNPDSGIDYSTEISALDLPVSQTIAKVSCSTSSLGSCIDSYTANSADITMQRLSINLDVSGTGDAQQVIYSTGNELPPVLEFGNTLDDIWANSSVVNAELSVTNESTSNFASFVAEQSDSSWLAKQNYTQPDFTDSITLLNSYLDRQEFDNERKATSFIRLDYAQ